MKSDTIKGLVISATECIKFFHYENTQRERERERENIKFLTFSIHSMIEGTPGSPCFISVQLQSNCLDACK